MNFTICPECHQENPPGVRYCRHCGASLSTTPSTRTGESYEARSDILLSTSSPSSKSSTKRKIYILVAVLLLLAVISQVGFYTVQPIGAVPDGVTLLVRRNVGEPFFNSPDAVCLKLQGEVSLLCRAISLSNAPVNRIILRLPYWEWAYLASTKGQKFAK